MNNEIVVVLTDGFEEIEALGTIDFLRRLEFNVVLAGTQNDPQLKGCQSIKGAHGIVVEADIELEDLKEVPDCFVLPGGMPGSINLRDNIVVTDITRKTFEKGNLVAAICAAPIALDAAGILNNRKVTAHPSVKKSLSDSVFYTGNRVEVDNNIITGKAAGASFEFAAKIAEYFGKGEEAEELLHSMYIVIG